MKNHILIMTKFPRAGEVNTRMIPVIGADEAALVHQRMAERTINVAGRFRAAKRIIHIANSTEAEAEHWLGASEWISQHGQDLGERMANAVSHSLALGATKVLIVGTDCPTLTEDIFEQALHALDEHDVVYAPAFDGGYVLVGVKEALPAVFQNIDWGTENVLQQSIQQLESNHLSHLLLEPMQDVDYAEDIPESFLS